MKRFTRIAGTVMAGALAAGTVAAAAPAASASTGSNPLINVLNADGDRFDGNRHDFDIVTEAAKAVLSAKPTSAVGVLTKGGTAVTAFIPNDQAFRTLVYDLTGKWLSSEQSVFNAVAGLGIPTVEKVLLYHVVPGATIDAATALKSDGAVLKTALGSTVGVKSNPTRGIVQLIDKDPDNFNPVVRVPDINKGNKQIAHGVNNVLRPFDLPN